MVTCGMGVTACILSVALSQCFPSVWPHGPPLHDGAWAEWNMREQESRDGARGGVGGGGEVAMGEQLVMEEGDTNVTAHVLE